MSLLVTSKVRENAGGERGGGGRLFLPAVCSRYELWCSQWWKRSSFEMDFMGDRWQKLLTVGRLLAWIGCDGQKIEAKITKVIKASVNNAGCTKMLAVFYTLLLQTGKERIFVFYLTRLYFTENTFGPFQKSVSVLFQGGASKLLMFTEHENKTGSDDQLWVG